MVHLDRPLLAALLDGSATHAEREQAESHLAACPACSALVVQVAAEVRERSLARPAVPGDDLHATTSFPLAAPGEACPSTVNLSAPAAQGGPDTSLDFHVLPPAEETSLGVLGDYVLLSKIAQGGMGVVYKARQQSLNRVVALKMMLGGQHAGEQQIQRFRTEAQAAANLDHPNIVPVFEVGEFDGLPFFSMGYVEGHSLQQRVAAGPLPPRAAAEMVRALSGAVQYAHQRGIVHRDLKPANVLLDAAGQPRITDFGLAKRIEADKELTASGQILGTPTYMSPEQAAGDSQQAGPACDLYALGAILYCLLTGRPPFQAASPLETVRMVLEQEPVPPRQLNASIPRDLETICLKCLQKKPRDRYPSAEELEWELARFLKGEPIRARRVGRAERLIRWCRRKPATAGLIVASVAAVVLLAGFLHFRQEYAAARTLAAARQQLADTQRYHSLVSDVRESAATRRNGWTWGSLEKLTEAAALEVEDADPVPLRTLAVAALAHVDVRPTPLIAAFRNEPHALAFSPDSQRFVVGPYRERPTCPVHLFDTTTRQKVGEYNFDTVAMLLGKSLSRLLDLQQSDVVEGVYALTFSPDGRQVAVGTRQGNIHLWSPAHPDQTRVLSSAQDVALDLAFSPDGRWLYGQFDDPAQGTHQLRRWDAESDWQEAPWGEVRVNHFAVSPDGKWLAFTREGALSLHHPDGRLYREFPEDANYGDVVFTPDSRYVVAENRHALDRYAIQTGEQVQILLDPTAARSPAGSLSVSGDGALLMTSGEGRKVRLWDAASGRVAAELVVPGSNNDRLTSTPPARLSSDGRWLAAAANNETQLHEVRRPTVTTTLAHTGSPVLDMDLSADGRTLVCLSESDGRRRSTLSVWSAEDGRLLRETSARAHPNEHVGFVEPYFIQLAGVPTRIMGDRVRLAPDGAHAVAASSLAGLVSFPLDGSAPHSLPLPTGRQVRVFQEDAFKIDGDPARVAVVDDPQATNGRAVRIAGKSPDCEIRVRLDRDSFRASGQEGWSVFAAIRVEYDAAEGDAFEMAAVTHNHTHRELVPLASWPGLDYHLFQMDVFDEGTFERGDSDWVDQVVLGVANPHVRAIWIDYVHVVPIYVRSWPSELSVTPQGPLAFSSDGQDLWGQVNNDHLASWSVAAQQTRTGWTNAPGEQFLSNSQLWSLAIGKTWGLMGAEDGTLWLFSTQTGQPQNRFDGPGGGVTALAILPGETRALIGADTGRLRLISLPERDTVTDLEEQPGGVTALALNGAGDLLAVGSRAGVVTLWRRQHDEFQPLLTLPAYQAPIQTLRLSANGRTLALLVQGEHAVRLWRFDQLNEELGKMKLGF